MKSTPMHFGWSRPLPSSDPGRARRGSRRRPPFRRVESLEERTLLSTFQPTIFTDSNTPGAGSLRDAVISANADTGTTTDTIKLQAGTYTLSIANVSGQQENAAQTGDLDLTSTTHKLIIEGVGSTGSNPTIIQATSGLLDRVFQTFSGTNVEIKDLVIEGGLALDDGTAGAIPGTTIPEGGGILNDGGKLTLDKVVVQDNSARGAAGRNGFSSGSKGGTGQAARGGGIYTNGGTLTLTQSTVAGNIALAGNGGAGGNHTNRGAAGGNGGIGQGGGMYVAGGKVTLNQSAISGNGAGGGSGGHGGEGFFKGGTGGNGGAGQGGGLFVIRGTVTLNTSSSLTGNEAKGGTGGTGGSASSKGGTGGKGGLGQGGGLYQSGGTITVTSNTVSSNTAQGGYGGSGGYGNIAYGTGGAGANGEGGGIFVDAGTLTLNQGTVTQNAADAGLGGGGRSLGRNATSIGGGLFNAHGTVTATGTTITGNSAITDPNVHGTVGGGAAPAPAGGGTALSVGAAGRLARVPQMTMPFAWVRSRGTPFVGDS
jgi:hypothetical protein